MHQLQLPSVILAACLVGTTALSIATPLARAQEQAVPSAAERMQQDGPEEAQLKQRIGTWDVTARSRLTPDATPIVTDGLLAERTMVGVYLQEVMKPAPGLKAPDFRRLAFEVLQPGGGALAVCLDGYAISRGYHAGLELRQGHGQQADTRIREPCVCWARPRCRRSLGSFKSRNCAREQ